MEIFLTKRANSKLIEIRDRIRNEWGDNVAQAFEDRVNGFFEVLKYFPEIGSIELAEKSIRGFQISKQTRVFYRVKGEKIIILNFFEVRQDPRKKF